MHAPTLHKGCSYPDAVSTPSTSRGVATPDPILVGDEHELLVTEVAHGGHMVARLGSFVVFVRHALPGETVRARITHVRSTFAHADVVAVLRAHPSRRTAPCSVAGVCGGCDFLHASEDLQRAMKTSVLTQALIRHGRLEPERAQALIGAGVESLGRDFGWRTRMHYRVSGGSVALKKYRSDEVVDVRDCVIADPIGHAAALRAAEHVQPGSDLWMATGLEGIVVAESSDLATVRHSIIVDGTQLEFETTIDGFWQVHPFLAQTLVDTVLSWGDPKPGETWWDLFAGVGPFAAAIGLRVGAAGRVHAVESSATAVRSARVALAGMPWVRCHLGDVGRWLGRPGRGRPQGVIVDPPRAGLGKGLVSALAHAGPELIVMIACDPVALGRDIALLAARGFNLERLRAWDAFPQTHHMEAIATFRSDDRIS